MAEMNAVARFFVNAFGGGRNRRRAEWVLGHAGLAREVDCLEIGAGRGDLAARIAVGVPARRYVATDLDERQVAAARRALRRRFPGGLPASLELRTADMLALPFADGTFDVVLAFTSLHHAGPSHRDATLLPRALNEVDRVLRPGGSFVYEEFLHRGTIRDWLHRRDYEIRATWSRRRTERVVAVKPRTPQTLGGPRTPRNRAVRPP